MVFLAAESLRALERSKTIPPKKRPLVSRWCRECLPEECFCRDCDVLHQKKQLLHNRECVIRGFFEAIPPTSCVIKGQDGYCIREHVKAPDCSCEETNCTIFPGKPVILITINGCFDLHQPLYVCQTCQHLWTPDLKDLLRRGYWPASDTSSTLSTLDLLSSCQELKVISRGFSRQAFAKLLEYRTKTGGRSGQINGDTLQYSFLEFSYASFEEDQLCCGAPFTWTPETLWKCFSRWKQKAISLSPRHKTQGKGTCGDSQWTTARETSRRASKLDEDGMEVAVCCHGLLLKALNMYGGRYLPTLCIFRRSSCQPRRNSLQWM
ncbi:uncharacterized protein LOC122137066 isoform X2 [Cyprinus carpio]|uniref:Uncharacterized protein LOC122137066 isoform X2 n=1 Tax=Cyprinus carpio TaxID=7962 RepID=A0A9Q9W7W7_CYPCA|nr:uncharacterized protein LOC122137066 isoform X2 [Cyprinus carpio]